MPVGSLTRPPGKSIWFALAMIASSLETSCVSLWGLVRCATTILIHILSAPAYACTYTLRVLADGSLTSQSTTRSAEATTVLDALRDNRWPSLEKLNAKTDCLPDGFDGNLSTVLEGGAGSNLRRIDLRCDSVESMREVGRVLRDGACPKLQSLIVYLKTAATDFTDSSEDEATCIEELRTWLSERGIRVNNLKDEHPSWG